MISNLTIGTSIIAFIVYYVFVAIAQWKMYAKAGEPGWKSLIPIYRVYILYKMSWSVLYFWAFAVFGFVSSLCTNYLTNTGNSNLIVLIIGLLASLVTIVFHIIQCRKLAASFGKNIGFTLGLIFLTPIFWLILGFGGAEYKK